MTITNRALQVAGVVRSPQLQHALAEAITASDGATLDLRLGELKAVAPDLLGREPRPDVLLLDVDAADATDMEALGRLIAEAGRARIPVVATAGDLGASTMRRLLRDGVADFIAQPIDHAEVLEVLRVVDRKARRDQAATPAEGRLLTFSRATGGAGATTLAVNIAHALALPRRRSQAKVCLIDLDLHFGTAALQLDLQPNTGLLDIARAPERLDGALFASSLAEHRSGLRVLTAPSAPMPLDALKPDLVAALLGLARAEFDYVIVDLPIALTQWTETVLSHSDLVYLVTQLNVPAVRQLRRLLDIIDEVGLYKLPVQLVLNRLQGSFGWGAGVRRRQAEKALGRPFDYCIADQFGVLIDAANRGAPVLDVRRYSRFGRQLRGMLKHSLRELAARPARAGAAH
ncbi:MAG: AAA family ATPase [Geminicoccaceae bacterium]